MGLRLCMVKQVYHETEIGWKLNYDGQLEGYAS